MQFPLPRIPLQQCCGDSSSKQPSEGISGRRKLALYMLPQPSTRNFVMDSKGYLSREFQTLTLGRVARIIILANGRTTVCARASNCNSATPFRGRLPTSTHTDSPAMTSSQVLDETFGYEPFDHSFAVRLHASKHIFRNLARTTKARSIVADVE
jgi:hypothetical protein